MNKITHIYNSYLIRQSFKGIPYCFNLSRALSSLHEWSRAITLTVPLKTNISLLIRRVYDSSARLDRKAGILDDRPAKLDKQFSIINVLSNRKLGFFLSV